MEKISFTISILIILVLIGNGGMILVYGQNSNLAITHGVASGDVTANSTMIWTRSNNQKAIMNVQFDTSPNFTHPNSKITTVNGTTDFTGHVKLDSLNPDTLYYYRVWFSSPDNSSTSDTMSGTFRTALDHSSSRSISFAMGGDLAGQRRCSRVDIGYPIFSVIKALHPDFFIANGDMIYGDNDCPARGPDNVTGWQNIPGDFTNITDPKVNWNDLGQLKDVYLKHWEYDRADPHLQGLLQNISYYSQADDHEVANDYGGQWSYYTNETRDRPGFPNVVKAGISTFFDFSPIDRNQTDPNRIYRSFNWGKDMDLFILDAHSYRSRNSLPDTANNKTLLGKEQVNWLEQGLLNSKATWKVVSDDDPIMIPNCSKEGHNEPQGCDNWATDGKSKYSFAKERNQFLKFLDDNNIKNVVFVTTDTHFPSNIVLNQDFNGDGDKLIIHELVSGPLNSGTFGPDPIDRTVNATYLYKESGIFNFGYYKIQKQPDGKMHFISEVRGIEGITRPGSYLDLIPQ